MSRVARDEYHLLIPVMALASGLGQIASGEVPDAMQAMPPMFQGVWAWTLIISSLLILTAAAVPDEDIGNWPELAGQSALGFVCSAYAAGVVFYLWGQIPFGTAIVFAAALAAFRRSYKLVRLLWPTEQSQRDKVIAEVQRLAVEHATTEMDEMKRDEES